MSLISPFDSCTLKNDIQEAKNGKQNAATKIERWLVYADKNDQRFLLVAAARSEKEALKIGRNHSYSMTPSAYAIRESNFRQRKNKF
jgi:hypothetical protein